MKGIGIFHQEFTGAHYPETGSNFITKLGLDLVEITGKLALAANFTSDQIGDDLFVGRAEAKFTVMTVNQA